MACSISDTQTNVGGGGDARETRHKMTKRMISSAKMEGEGPDYEVRKEGRCGWRSVRRV